MREDAGGRGQLGAQHFEAIKTLGKGSYGKVVLVRCNQGAGESLFAMKVLKKDHILKRGQVKHTMTEKSVLRQLSYPFIVRIFHAFATPSRLHLVLEYCAGGELFFHLERAERFDEGRSRFYGGEVTLAMEYLHRLGVVYRDLKPENVLLDQRGHAKLTDFGLCKEGVWDNFSAKTLCGTPEYMAPELLERRGAGRAADWYALGILMFEMLTGTPPFTDEERPELDRQILEGVVHFPDYVKEGARAFVLALLHRAPNRRLGGGLGDGEEVRGHTFFDGVDWIALERMQIAPPFRPVVLGREDVQNFDEDYVKLPLSTCSTASGASTSMSSRSSSCTASPTPARRAATPTESPDPFEGFAFRGEDDSMSDVSED